MPNPTLNIKRSDLPPSYGTKDIFHLFNNGHEKKTSSDNAKTTSLTKWLPNRKNHVILELKLYLLNIDKNLGPLKIIQRNYDTIIQNKDKIIIPAVQKEIEKELPNIDAKINQQEESIKAIRKAIKTITAERIELLKNHPDDADALNKLNVKLNAAVKTYQNNTDELVKLGKQVNDLFAKAKSSLPEEVRLGMRMQDLTAASPRARS